MRGRSLKVFDNRKGFIAPAMLIGVIIVGLVAVLMLGVGVIFFQYFDLGLNQNVMIGQVNLSEVHNQTFAKLSGGFIDNADNYGIAILTSLMAFIVFAGYLLREKMKLLIIVDIIFILVAFILSVYISQVYYAVINSAPLFSVYTDTLNNSSRFILNLPLIVGAVGVLTMIFTYAKIRGNNNTDVEPY